MMAVVTAVSVSPTVGVPVIVGAPVAGVLVDAETVAVAALVSGPSVWLVVASVSRNETFTLIFLPSSSATSVYVLSLAPEMSASVPLVTRTHWKLVLVSVRKGSGNPSTSAMVPAVAASVCPTCAVPVIPGWPVAASFTRYTRKVSVYVAALSSVPSFTLKVKLVKGILPPFRSPGGRISGC